MLADDNDYFSGLYQPDPQQIGIARANVLRARNASSAISPIPGANVASNFSPIDAAAKVAALRGRGAPADSPKPDAPAPAAPANALSFQRQGPDPSFYGQMGLLATLSGDPVLGRFGRAALDYSNQIREGEGQRLLRSLEQQRIDNEQKYRDAVLASERLQKFFDPTTNQWMGIDSRHPERGAFPLTTGGQKMPPPPRTPPSSSPQTPTAPFFGEDFEPLDPSSPPQLDKKEVADLRGRYAANLKLQDLLKQYEDTLNSAGDLERIAGPDAQKLTTLQALIKPVWVESNGFKRFTENEDALVNAALPKASGSGVFRLDPSIKAAIQTIRSSAQSDIDNNLRARGLKLRAKVVERRQTDDGRTLEKLSDGTVRVVQ